MAGFELGYENFAFLRAGVNNVTRAVDFNGDRYYTVQPNLGLGIKYRGISLDYALSNIGSASDLTYSNIFSVKFNFGAFKKG